ncbi:hypothetical protein RDWZM_008683, partial [Blomia tropicalis]
TTLDIGLRHKRHRPEEYNGEARDGGHIYTHNGRCNWQRRRLLPIAGRLDNKDVKRKLTIVKLTQRRKRDDLHNKKVKRSARLTRCPSTRKKRTFCCTPERQWLFKIRNIAELWICEQ